MAEYSKNIKVTVTKEAIVCTCEITGITIDDVNVELAADGQQKTVRLNPQAVVSGNCGVEGHPNNVTFTYSVKSGEDVVSVNATGVVTAKKEGEATITVVARVAKTDEEVAEYSKNIKVTVTKEEPVEPEEPIEAPTKISYVAPAAGMAPMGAGVDAELNVADRADNPVTLVQKEGSEISIKSTDDVYGFAGQFATDSATDKFDVYGTEAMTLLFKLYLKKQAPDSTTPQNENNINILGKMNSQYGFQISPKGIILYMENASRGWPQHDYAIDKTFYNKWHNVAIVIDGKGKMCFYVDGNPSIQNTENGRTTNATAKHSSDHFTLGYGWDMEGKGSTGELTDEYGYLADVQLFRGEDLTDGLVGVEDYQGLTDLLAQLRAEAMITAIPYSMSTTWIETGSGEVLGADAIFEADKLYTATTEFTAYGDGVFENSDAYKAEVKNRLEGVENADITVDVSADGKTLTVSVAFKETRLAECTCEITGITQADKSIDLQTEKTVVLNPEFTLSEDCKLTGHPNEKSVTLTYSVKEGNDVVDVASDGTVTAKKAGTATITVTATLSRGEGEEPATATKDVTIAVTDVVGIELTTAISDAEAKIAGDKEALYTEASVNALKEAIDNAKKILDNPSAYTPNQVKTAINRLDKVDLVLQAEEDKKEVINELNDVIEDAQKIIDEQNKEGLYTPAAYERLQSILAAAKAAIARGDEISIDELKAALNELNDAMKLETVYDAAKAALAKAIANADAVYAAGSNGYTADSWKAFAEAYTAAKAASDTADAAALNALADTLVKAQAGLVKADAPTPVDTLKKGDTLTKNGITFKVLSASKKTVTVSKVTSKKKKVTIPATVTIKGVKCGVVQIGAKAFKACKKTLRTVVIGKNVTKIGKQAFAGCSKLKTVTFKGNKVKSIKKNAFKKTASKVTVKVPKSMKSKARKTLLNKMKKRGLSKKSTIKTGK